MQTLVRVPRSALPVLALVAALLVGATTGAVAAAKITGKDIALNTITGANVKAGSLAASDLSSAAKATLKGNRGPAGPRGTTGAPGPGFDDFAYYFTVAEDVPPGTDGLIAQGTCPDGQSVVSAFAYWSNDNAPLQVSVGYVDDALTTMGAVAYSTGIGSTQSASLQFSCATLPLPSLSARKALPSLR